MTKAGRGNKSIAKYRDSLKQPMNNLSPETLDKLRTEIAFIASAQPGHINIDSAADRIASLLTPSVEGNSVENNEQALRHIQFLLELYKRTETYSTSQVIEQLESLWPAYAQSLRPGGGWEIKELEWKPDEEDDGYVADTVFGRYSVFENISDTITLSTPFTDVDNTPTFDTIESAKYHAQQDYAARIKTALKTI